MALPSEYPRSFALYVTHVDSEGHFVKISGQRDKQSTMMIERLFVGARQNLESGIGGAVIPSAVCEGLVCAAKFKDGSYYRAKVIDTSDISTTGMVGLHFIDFGNKDSISLSDIRFLDKYDPMFIHMPGQATDYYLSRVIHPAGQWDEQLLHKLQNLICYGEYLSTIVAQTQTLPIIAIQYKGIDLSSHLVANRFGIELPVTKQEMLLAQIMGPSSITTNWPSNNAERQPCTEHVPFLVNQNFPTNPASTMRVQQNTGLPFNNTVPPPSLISQRLLVNKVSRTPVNIKAPMRQPQSPPAVTSLASASTPPQPPPVSKPAFSDKNKTYKSRLLEVGSQHSVFVSFADKGPEVFAVQLAANAAQLEEMMDSINRRPHSSLAEPPMIGTVCLGRMSVDRIICRAVVINLSGSQCQLYFVDFGDTEMVSYYDIFDIPEEFIKPKVFALRFCLSGVKKLKFGPHLTETFKQLVVGNVMTLRVVQPEGPPLMQYGELFLDGLNILDLLIANNLDAKTKLEFKTMETLPLGSWQSVMCSYVDSCLKFYLQLSEHINELNTVMDEVKAHCESSSSPGELPVGAACCALFPEDNSWYRAKILQTHGSKVTVSYVDYGNEQEVNVADLRTITPSLTRLPAQALKCALKGFETKPVEIKSSNQLEMLALEKTLNAHIVGVLSSDTMLVSLVNELESPPLDIARKMNELSTPQAQRTAQQKAATSNRKDASESFSSPEGSDKKGFRREKSFKDERRPREENDEFGQRGGSFRARDNNEGFDRSAPGRHSDKFGGRERPERGDRRGPKPWERDVTPAETPLPGNDDWDESPALAQNNYQRKDNRNDRRNRPDPGGRPNWNSRDRESGAAVGKRRQAADPATSDTRGFSVQDRLKRDNKFNQQDEKKDEWGHKNENRPDKRSDNWGERKDFGERKDYGERKDFQKREFRDNNRERSDRNDRPRSNFTPRDRADRSFGSNNSDKSQDAGRAPPYKPRSKFTAVQYKELSEPVPLETPYPEPVVEAGAQHEVSVTWIISPESFYSQIVSLTPKFLEMMHKIPDLYKGVKSYTGMVPVGASVLARYPADGVLYRATVVAVQPFSKFIVQYIDFGNKQLVEAKDIWQLDNELMDLPKMAVHCSLLGVAPKDGEWKSNNPDIDLCFNAPRYQCVFQEIAEQQWKVCLYNNGANVADLLVEKQLAVTCDHQSSVALKDEAIDLTIIVGQQMLCKVTHVVSFDKFYIQLDLDKAALVEEAVANFDATKLTPLTADNLTDGVHCTVRHNDKVYRAILNDVTDPQNVQAVLPDYGMTITTSLANLMILPTELSVYYYQSLNCTLHNYTAESNKLITDDELRTTLQGNKFIIYINDVDGINLVSTLYEIQTGKKVAIFEPDEGAFDEVIPLCTRAVFNYNFGLAYISHAESFNELYLQKSTDTDNIAVLLDEIFKFYEEGTPEPLAAIEADALCAAKSSDGNWYRATVISVDEQVTVQYTDYGNSETVAKDVLKVLDPKFYQPCALALVASLGVVQLQDDAMAKLLEWTTDKELQVTLACGAEGWLASLHLDGVDLSMKLVNEKLATPQVATEEKAEATVESVSLPPGCTQSYISHIDTPGHFWLQMADKVDTIDEIQAELQANAETYANVENRETGTVCVAKYLADEQWYRAEILDADADITTVRFIDYGNTDVLDNQPGLIKTIPDKYKDVERYAVKSSVNAIPTGTGEWSEQAAEYFTQLVGDISVPLQTLIVLKDVTTYVDLFVNGQNITDKLVSEGYATKSEAAECGDLPSCFASHVNSPSEFWIQLETATPELEAMETAMVDAENFPELSVKEEGVICAAKYPEDGAWYRAQVIVDGSEGTEVLFMDYGNASIANELRSLPDELKTNPALSRKCALQKPRDIKAWSRKSEVKFNELAAEGATIFKVQFIASGDISIVELLHDNKSVTEVLVALCEETSTPVVERPTPVGQDLRSSGKICYIQSLEEFYVQLDSSADLDKISERLSSAADFEAISELKVGSICAALFSEDEQWYRAKVLEFCDVGYHVQFIDFGNKAKCEKFRQLSEDIAGFEPQAKCCRLAGLENNTANQNMKAKLYELAAVPDLTFQIEFLDSTKEPALVKLLLDGKDVLTILADNSADAPTNDNEVVPKVDSEIAPTGDNEVVAKVDSEVAVTSDNEVAQTGDNEVVPKVDIEVAVTSDNEVAPTGDNEVVSKVDSEVAVTSDNEVAQTGDNEVVPTGDNKVAQTGDNEVVPKVDIEVAVTSDNEVAVTSDNEVAPTGDNEVVPKVDSEVVPTGENEVVPTGENEVVPSETITGLNIEAKKDEIHAQGDKKDTAIETRENEPKVVNQVPETEVPVIEDTSIVKEIDIEVPPKLDTQEFNVAENLESKKFEKEVENSAEEICSELNVSNDLDESVDSSSTVIENKSFDGTIDTSSEEFKDAESPGNESSDTLEKSNNELTDTSTKSNDTSNDTVKTTERDESKESVNTDTGYTSDHEDKISPMKDENVCENTIILDVQPENNEKSKENITESGEPLKVNASPKKSMSKSSMLIAKKDATKQTVEKDLNKTF